MATASASGAPLLWHFPISHFNEKVRWALDWKGIRQNLMPRTGRAKAKAKDNAEAVAEPNMHIELYNLADDPHEERDVSAEHPDVVAKVAKLMRDQHVPSKEFPLPALDNQ